MKKKILIVVGGGMAAAALLGCIFGIPQAVLNYKYSISYPKKYTVTQEAFDGSNGNNRIHFLNTGGSDAILIESNGHFALVDCGEDSDNPRGFPDLELQGYEQEVLKYLKDHAAGDDGKVVLDFVVGTHAHSDHIGGFDTIISDDDIVVKKAYLKPYDSSKISDYEVEKWDNQEVYDQMVKALNDEGAEIISDIPDSEFTFGDFTCKFFNGEVYTGDKKRGENENSLGLLLTCNGSKAFLAGDINNIDGTEDAIGKKIGKVDLLKFGHHGYDESTSTGFIEALMPDIGILTNKSIFYSLNSQSKKDVVNISKTAVYSTGENKGIIANFTDKGIVLTNNIME